MSKLCYLAYTTPADKPEGLTAPKGVENPPDSGLVTGDWGLGGSRGAGEKKFYLVVNNQPSTINNQPSTVNIP